MFNDVEAFNIIANRLTEKNISSIEKTILSFVILIMKDFSFTNNQTYPRPSHPDPTKRKDAYFTLIAIILSLRTTLENEQKAVNLFLNKFSSLEDVANSNVDEIKNIISCAGMPTKKAQTILDVTNYIINNYSGDINKINNGNVLEMRNKLMDFPGIGEKSADCMLELGFDLPSIVVDTNVFRVVTRLFFKEENMSFGNNQDVLKVKMFLEKNIINDYRVFQIIHTMLLLQGKHICRSSPHCEDCKLSNRCNYYANKHDSRQLRLF